MGVAPSSPDLTSENLEYLKRCNSWRRALSYKRFCSNLETLDLSGVVQDLFDEKSKSFLGEFGVVPNFSMTVGAIDDMTIFYKDNDVFDIVCRGVSSGDTNQKVIGYGSIEFPNIRFKDEIR